MNTIPENLQFYAKELNLFHFASHAHTPELYDLVNFVFLNGQFLLVEGEWLVEQKIHSGYKNERMRPT